MQSEPVAVTLRVTQALDTLRVPYAIGGSMASSAHGRIRTTMDVDIIADLKIEQVGPLTALLGDEFYADPQMMQAAIARRSSFNLIHLATMFKVDIFIIKDRSFDWQQIARRQPRVLEPPDRIAYVTSPEDVILAKLEWYRLGGELSERQWRDIQGILDVQGERLDDAYLREWASVLQVDDLLAQAWQERQNRLPQEKNDETTDE
jgi:hypothetical protein